MIWPHEPYYAANHPPVMIVNRRVEFECMICHKTGWGPPNMLVHAGPCREERVRQIAARAAVRKKARKVREKERNAAALLCSQ